MRDFDAMLKGMHERNIKLVMDLVVNHSSDEIIMTGGMLKEESQHHAGAFLM